MTLSISASSSLGFSTILLNNWVSSFITFVSTRSNALPCSIRAFSSSEFRRAFLKAASAATREGNRLRDELPHAVGVLPHDVAEVVVELLHDLR